MGAGNALRGRPWAIDAFIEYPTDTRFFQSFKTYAANSTFQYTSVYGKRHYFEDILAAFFESVRSRGGADLEGLPRLVSAGRSSSRGLIRTRRWRNSATKPRSAASASKRSTTSWSRLPLPISTRTSRPPTVLVGDFGGGTSDFSIVRFEPTARGIHAYPISYSGVGIAC